MIKVFYKDEEISVNDLRLTWEDRSGRIHSGDLIDYRNSEVCDALSEIRSKESQVLNIPKTDYLEECQKEIQLMLNEFIGRANTLYVRDIIKFKIQDIIDRYIQEGKLSKNVRSTDFDVYIESFTKLQ